MNKVHSKVLRLRVVESVETGGSTRDAVSSALNTITLHEYVNHL